ncbi:exodeoxyribonuclease III [Variovorax sp. J22R24]|uniref:exodeoxyribonuclease III n=1 Tax=Variovorax gracilis TaxID=3053502 RepID=UPI002577009B|nr:exodeoxyribonuclease III [Variovorax sp. J22R24]MDM0108881.1 exodeoxyribonuclease III [Variovorax sp. J22R24]
MKIATFNVNGIVGRLDRLLEWLAESKPDVACLQELKSPDAKLPLQALRNAGYGVAASGQPSWNGVAILAREREPMELGRGVPGMEADPQSRYIEAVVDGVVVGCLYLPNGNPQPGPKFDYKLSWFARFNAHAKKLSSCGLPVVLAGDYNVVPTDADIYNPTSWRDDALLQPESRAAFMHLLQQGWTDAIRACHPDGVPYTFWTYWRDRYARDAGLRIDHLLLNAEVAPMLRGAGVDREVRGRPGASDHAPAWIELDIPRA